MLALRSIILRICIIPVSFALLGCDQLPSRLSQDPEGTSLNASTSYGRGVSSTGALGTVRQVTTGRNKFAFKEIWAKGKGKGSIATIGNGTYEPSTNTNIYEYSQPKGIVVARTREWSDGATTEDLVLASTLSIFTPGERITYTLLSK